MNIIDRQFYNISTRKIAFVRVLNCCDSENIPFFVVYVRDILTFHDKSSTVRKKKSCSICIIDVQFFIEQIIFNFLVKYQLYKIRLIKKNLNKKCIFARHLANVKNRNLFSHGYVLYITEDNSFKFLTTLNVLKNTYFFLNSGNIP